MLIIPAIDIRGGKTVRLLRGDPAQAIVYGDDAVTWAQDWIEQGARWLHVVDLDGAFAGHPVHLDLLRRLCALGAPVQAGGGFRAAADIAAGLEAGASRVIIGTAALDLGDDLAPYGDRLAVSLDVRDGYVAVEGWQAQTAVTAAALATTLRSRGVRRMIYTDIERDGMLAGPNVGALRAFVAAAGVPVIAAGGIRSERDLEAVALTGVEAAIVGRALYEGQLDLRASLLQWRALPC